MQLDSAPEAWEFVFEQSGVRASRQSVPGSPLAVMRGEGDIPIPAHLLYEMLRDVGRKAEWDKMFAHGRDLERLDPNSGMPV